MFSTSQRATVFPILVVISFSHLLNDMVQSLLPAVYPLLKASYNLNFTQVGFITLAYQMTASILQPFVGIYTDRKPMPYSLAWGMGMSLIGLALLSRAGSFPVIVTAACLIGMGSAIFHPESSRVAHMASGGQFGLAQSLFQVGGNAGSSLGPLLAAWIVVPRGQGYILWFSLAASVGIVLLSRVGNWYSKNMEKAAPKAAGGKGIPATGLGFGKIAFALAILSLLVFSKYFYLAGMVSYYTFYLIGKFHVSIQSAQIHLFLFLFAVAAGTFIGGPVGDGIGRKRVIWGSILGVAPFTLLLPYANLFWTSVLSVCIGVILASAFSAILVYAQELVPGKVGMIAGLFFGLAFGMGGIGSAALGWLADRTSIEHVFHVCSFLPLIGLITGFLPDVGRKAPVATETKI